MSLENTQTEVVWALSRQLYMYERVMVMSHVNEPWHIFMIHGTYECEEREIRHVNESCTIIMGRSTYERVISHKNAS